MISIIVVIIMFVLLIFGFASYRMGPNRHAYIDEYAVIKRFKDSNDASLKIHKLGIKGVKISLYEPHTGPGTIAYESIMRLRNIFRPKNVSENDVVSKRGHVSETTDMKYISIALRKKDGSFHSDNLIDYVFFHELAHVATPAKYLIRDGSASKDDGMHTSEYWAVYSMILNIANELGIYSPKDYSKYPADYNGIVFTSNQYYTPGWQRIVY